MSEFIPAMDAAYSDLERGNVIAGIIYSLGKLPCGNHTSPSGELNASLEKPEAPNPVWLVRTRLPAQFIDEPSQEIIFSIRPEAGTIAGQSSMLAEEDRQLEQGDYVGIVTAAAERMQRGRDNTVDATDGQLRVLAHLVQVMHAAQKKTVLTAHA